MYLSAKCVFHGAICSGGGVEGGGRAVSDKEQLVT